MTSARSRSSVRCCPCTTHDVLRAWYEDFRERHGIRPRAVEAFHEGYAPRAVRRSYGSWLRFVDQMGDLPEPQASLVRGAAAGPAGRPPGARVPGRARDDPDDQELQDDRPPRDAERGSPPGHGHDRRSRPDRHPARAAVRPSPGGLRGSARRSSSPEASPGGQSDRRLVRRGGHPWRRVLRLRGGPFLESLRRPLASP